MDKIECHKNIRVVGNSLAIFLTKELKAIGVDYGDTVKLTIEKP